MKQLSYTVYGAREEHPSHLQLGFNGEKYDLLSGCYPLGLGYRMYSPSLMRFLSPDSLSPFGRGGLNAFGYCVNDPVNHVDPTGHMLQTPRPSRSPSPTLISRRSPPRWSTSPKQVPSGRSTSVSPATTQRVLAGYNGQEIKFPLDFLNVSPSSTVPTLPSNTPLAWPEFFKSKGFSTPDQISNESRRLASSISFDHVVGDPDEYRMKIAIYMSYAGISVEPNFALRYVYPGITPFQLGEIAQYAEAIRLPANPRTEPGYL